MKPFEGVFIQKNRFLMVRYCFRNVDGACIETKGGDEMEAQGPPYRFPFLFAREGKSAVELYFCMLSLKLCEFNFKEDVQCPDCKKE